MTKLIQITGRDNVAVALHPVAKGETLSAGSVTITAIEDIPQGHKIALEPIAEGAAVVKYGYPIGHTTAAVQTGAWVHTHNMRTNLSGEEEYTYTPAVPLGAGRRAGDLPRLPPQGRARAAVRNEIWIIPTVGCVNDVAKKLVRDNQDLVTGSIDGLYTFTHPYGCSQTGADHAQTRKLLAALVRHPNAGAVLVLSLGCENLQHDQFVEELGPYDADRVKFLTCQDVEDEFAAGRALLEQCAAYAAQFSRQPIPVSDLVIGMKCGGSDGLSGVTANPTVGAFSDMMIARGGSTVLTEVPEMFGAEGMLLSRCVSREVFDKAASMLNNFKDYFISHHETVYENPSPRQQKGRHHYTGGQVLRLRAEGRHSADRGCDRLWRRGHGARSEHAVRSGQRPCLSHRHDGGGRAHCPVHHRPRHAVRRADADHQDRQQQPACREEIRLDRL